MLWIIADVFEQDLARVQVGQGAQVTLEAWPGRSFAARADYLYPTLDPATRSTRVRLELDNAQGLLRPGHVRAGRAGGGRRHPEDGCAGLGDHRRRRAQGGKRIAPSTRGASSRSR